MSTIVEVPFPESRTPPVSIDRETMGRGAQSLLMVVLAVQTAHLGLHFMFARPTFISDLVQAVAAVLSAVVCLYKVRRKEQQRLLWTGMATAFAIWAVAQFYFAFEALKPGVTDVQASEFLWLIYAFSILLVASYTPRASRGQAAVLFDAAQAGIFFCILFALFFPAPGIITQAISDDVQGVALLLALVLRYCIAAPGIDRIFYRNLATYMAVYVFFCVLYYLATTHGFAVGSVAELCWSIPFTFFSVLTLCAGPSKRARTEQRDARTRLAHASYVQGASALGLAIMSMTASAVLAYHRPLQGAAALIAAFALFGARTCVREWQLQTAHTTLNYSALHDPVTSMANRTLLNAEITRRLASAPENEGGSTSILFVGLDRFKTMNDCLGHAFGDLLLRRVAELLSSSIRSDDLVARYGGDEFVLLLDKSDIQQAEAFAERILETLRAPMLLEGRMLNLTASIGYAVGSTGTTAADMLQQAHFAMHHAKKAGRGRALAFEAEMVRVPQYKLALETDLRRALERNEITLCYQPIFAINGGGIEGFEALARWKHPERGPVSPLDFIAVAEDTGMILDLGEQILRKACQQCRDWNLQFGTRYTMNVNVSAHQFASPDLLRQIVDTLQETGLDPRLLKLEITESVLLSGYSSVERVLSEVRSMGVQICLDDFGTGYSSLSYLLNYSFDVVKIDQSFVRNMDEDPRRADVVRMLVALAASLNKRLVAEGVERAAEMDCLRASGCEFVQGYLLSKPLSAEVAMVLLEAQKQLVPTDTMREHGGRETRESRRQSFLIDAKVAEPAA